MFEDVLKVYEIGRNGKATFIDGTYRDVIRPVLL
jgi:hypothetical protein